jgi:energy-coupling factor transporter ATP-binding protein EcfA2
VHFTRLRLTGFKSFVDTTDLLIEPGLTAIIGPNGCGKSNLVEALRWVMGESSARQLRGREMDDVIFSGSATRPARNHAEVAVLLDNAARTAPSAFNDDAEIEVSRRIERGEGSVYRINGRETRARDVQLLFADETTGARSTALVSQGEIGSLIAAALVPVLAFYQDAPPETILFALGLKREDVYIAREQWQASHPESPGDSYPAGIAQLIVAKHRNGPTGTVHLRFQQRVARFEDLLVREEELV